MRVVIAILDWLTASVVDLTYPLPTDPKNIAHVLWKAGIDDMNPEEAMGAMVGDGIAPLLSSERPERNCRSGSDTYGSPTTPPPTCKPAWPVVDGRTETKPWFAAVRGW
jgi:hypothetical protein